MQNDQVLQTSDEIRTYIQNILESIGDRNHVDYFTIIEHDTADLYKVNWLIIISVETFKDKFPVSTRQEPNRVTLSSFKETIQDFKEKKKEKAGNTYRRAALI